MGLSDWVRALKIDPLLLDYILLTIHLRHVLTVALLVSEWGDRKAWCSSHQYGLVLITTSLSLQETAYSLACHFRDNTISQIWTSSFCSHVSFLTFSILTVILPSKPKVWQTSADCFTIWVKRGHYGEYKLQTWFFLSIVTMIIKAKQIMRQLKG